MKIEERWPFEDANKLQLFSMNTPNGIKVSCALEELEVPYEPHVINIIKGDQHEEAFRSISPNGKIPAIVDPDGPGGRRLELMESGAILLHLAEKTGKLLPIDPIARLETLQWVFFQVGHIGPMLGQFGHFHMFARDTCDHPYPLERYQNETKRLLGVLDAHLSDGREYVMGDLTIADFAIFPWLQGLVGFYKAGPMVGWDDLEHVPAFLERCMARPSWEKGKDVCSPG